MGRFLYGFMTTQKRPEYVCIHTQKDRETYRQKEIKRGREKDRDGGGRESS